MKGSVIGNSEWSSRSKWPLRKQEMQGVKGKDLFLTGNGMCLGAQALVLGEVGIVVVLLFLPRMNYCRLSFSAWSESM